MTDAELLDNFEEEISAQYKETTANTYRTGPRAFVRWLGHESKCPNPHPSGYRTKLQYCISEEGNTSNCTDLLLNGLTKTNVYDFVKDLKNDDYGHTTIRSYYFGIKEFADYAGYEGLLRHDHPLNYKSHEDDALDRYNIRQTNTKKQDVNVAKYWDDRKMTNLNVVAFPAEIIHEIINNAPAEGSQHRNSLLLKVLWQTGIRAVEASQLRWEQDVELDDRTLRIKTAKQHGDNNDKRFLSFRDNLDTLFRVWKDDEQPALTRPDTEYVFSTEQKEQMSPNRINQIVRAAADAAGYSASYETKGGKRHEFSAHIFRSSYATHCANFVSEIDIDDLMYLLGHASLSETQKYILRNPEQHVKASRHGPK